MSDRAFGTLPINQPEQPAASSVTRAIKAIRLSLPLRLGSVNCYLLASEFGHILIDSGSANGYTALARELTGAGCMPGDLQLVILTHGDFDHTGNCARIRAEYGAKIAMHRDDSAMLEHGDMFANRKRPNLLVRKTAPVLFGFGRSKQIKPDLLLNDGESLAEHGLDARVISLPGHSRGSIGVLTNDGELFCGDLLDNVKGPAVNGIMDDPVAAEASIEKLKGLQIQTIYPGHGEPFAMQHFWRTRP